MEIIAFIILVLVYFLPSIMGYSKGNAVAIFALNFFLGWTLIGWVIALVWSLSNDKKDTIVIHPNGEKSLATEISELKVLHSQGILTDTEFEEQKTKLLNK